MHPAPVHVLVSNSRDDTALREELRSRLAGPTRQGLLLVWDDGWFLPEASWKGGIWRHLNAANVVLPLVGASFMASDFAQREMERVLERRQAEGVLVIPALIRPSHFGGSSVDGIGQAPAVTRCGAARALRPLTPRTARALCRQIRLATRSARTPWRRGEAWPWSPVCNLPWRWQGNIDRGKPWRWTSR